MICFNTLFGSVEEEGFLESTKILDDPIHIRQTLSAEVSNMGRSTSAEEHSLLATSIGLIVGLVGVEVFSSEE